MVDGGEREGVAGPGERVEEEEGVAVMEGHDWKMGLRKMRSDGVSTGAQACHGRPDWRREDEACSLSRDVRGSLQGGILSVFEAPPSHVWMLVVET